MTHDSAFAPPATAIARHSTAGLRAPSMRRRRKVVLVQTQAEGAGAQEISRILGHGLVRLGYDVHHVFFFRRTAAYDTQPNTVFCALQRPGGIFGVARMFAALVRHLRQLEPDAVLCFQHYGNIVGALAARLAGTRAIVANRTSARALEPGWTRWVDRAFGTAGLFRRVVVNSQAIAEEYRSYPPRYQARLRRIDHGFEAKTTTLSRSEARNLLGLPTKVPLLGSVARLHPSKNLEAAIRLLTIDPQWHLALAGQGAAREQLAQYAGSLGVSDRVHFAGELPPDRIGAFLRALDVFVFPSLAESFGLAVVEAAQAGVPVVANDLEVLREVLAVEGSPCALFADAGDPQAFAAAVQRLLRAPDLRASLAARGTGLARRYSLDEMVARYAALIEEVGTDRTTEARR